MTDRIALWTVLRLTLALLSLIAASYGADWMLRAENVPVQSVRFEGPFKRVTHPELEDAVLDLMRGNFFLVDLAAVQRRLEALPWVQRAVVYRRFPQDIAVRFTEQRLAARWGESAWLNTSGEVVRMPGDALPSSLPRLDGPKGASAEALAAYRKFQATLAPLGLDLAGVALSARRTWKLEVETPAGGRLTLVVGQEQPLQRLERFARAYTALAERAASIERVDLRYTNGFAVAWHQGGGRARATRTAARNEG